MLNSCNEEKCLFMKLVADKVNKPSWTSVPYIIGHL